MCTQQKSDFNASENTLRVISMPPRKKVISTRGNQVKCGIWGQNAHQSLYKSGDFNAFQSGKTQNFGGKLFISNDKFVFQENCQLNLFQKHFQTIFWTLLFRIILKSKSPQILIFFQRLFLPILNHLKNPQSKLALVKSLFNFVRFEVVFQAKFEWLILTL